jgi:hypothetical protein
MEIPDKMGIAIAPADLAQGGLIYMLTQQKLIVSLALVLFSVCVAASAGAEPLVYVVTAPSSLDCLSDMPAPAGTHCGQFGTVDLATGAFHQIGPDTPESQVNLVRGPNGSLLSVTFFGDLESIDPTNGAVSVIGASGLGGLQNELAELHGKLYMTDFSNNLYTANPATGAASLIGPTGIAAVPPGEVLFDETLYGVKGKIYATFDALDFDLTVVIAPKLYRIDQSTGVATFVAPTMLSISASVNVRGTFYVFKEVAPAPAPPALSSGEVFTLDLKNGRTRFVTNIDKTATAILGAFPVPPRCRADGGCSDGK